MGTDFFVLQVVGNLQRPQSDHAARVAQFAIQAVHVANSIPILEDDPSSATVSIRAGEQHINQFLQESHGGGEGVAGSDCCSTKSNLMCPSSQFPG